jgi:hypothetical protein
LEIFVGRAEQVTDFIKRFDRQLYCEKGRDGKLRVFRKDQRIESYDVDGITILFTRPAPYLVFALTEDWTLNTAAIDWGLEPILARLKACDLWARDLATESIKSIEHANKSRERAVDNHIESYLIENRREFARRTNDINTSTLNRKTGDI